jgi:hypothetical protein
MAGKSLSLKIEFRKQKKSKTIWSIKFKIKCLFITHPANNSKNFKKNPISKNFPNPTKNNKTAKRNPSKSATNPKLPLPPSCFSSSNNSNLSPKVTRTTEWLS